MRLFLTSSPCDDLVPEGCTLPCILFECNHFVENLRHGWQPGQRAVIVAASPDAHALNDEMTCTFHNALAWHGMQYVSTTLVDDRNEYDLPQLISESSLVILAGGHVPTENAFFKRIHLRELLRDYTGTIMGISAGSMNCCEHVYAQPEEPGEAIDPAYQRFISGLGLTHVMVLPHYYRVRNNILDGMRLFEDITYGDSYGRTFYALPDSSYVMQVDGRATIFGEAYRIRNGVMTQICEDESTFDLGNDRLP